MTSHVDSEILVSERVIEETVGSASAVEAEELSLVGLSLGSGATTWYYTRECDPFMKPVWQSGRVDVHFLGKDV